VSPDRIADYTLKSEIGQGGMGKVFLADSPEGREVALKTVIFPEGLSARARWETVERFQREARAARSLEHPNICQVLDFGADEDTFFIVMEFLAGRSLRDEIHAAGKLDPPRAMSILLGVYQALAYAHEKGIVHRDIKPDNIMLLNAGPAKLMDFGLAAIVHETGVTQTGTMMGTFSYMSPEQARGEKLDPRSDIFSLGVTFYEMLTGRQAFQGEAPGAVIQEILNTEVEPVSGLPGDVSRVLNKCLRKRPSYRFQTALEIIAALRAAGAAPTPSAATAVQGTMVMSGGAATPPPGSSAAAPPRPASSSAPAASNQTPPPAKRSLSKLSAPDLRCAKCHEPMLANSPSCWKCGTPNPAIARRKAFNESQAAISDALQDYKPRKKRGWFRR